MRTAAAAAAKNHAEEEEEKVEAALFHSRSRTAGTEKIKKSHTAFFTYSALSYVWPSSTVELRFSHGSWEQKKCDLIEGQLQYRTLLSKLVSQPNVTKLKFVTKSKFYCTEVPVY